MALVVPFVPRANVTLDRPAIDPPLFAAAHAVGSSPGPPPAIGSVTLSASDAAGFGSA